MNKRSGIFGYGPEDIETFKERWPCHGFPDNLNCVIAAFATNGDLVELDAFDAGGENIDTETIYGTAWTCLIDDIQEYGYIARQGSAENYYE